MAKSIKKNFLYNILLNISKVIFPLITAPYVSRVLEPDGVGLFNFANTYANYFALFAALGIPLYGIREIAKVKDDQKEQTKFVSEIISISAVVTFICTVLFFLSLLFVPQLSANYLIFIVAGIALYITPFHIDWYFSGMEEFGYITFRSLSIRVLSVLLLFILVHDKDDLIIYVAINACCGALNSLWNFVKLYNLGIHPYFTLRGKVHVKPLLILFSSSIAVAVYNLLDTIMLGFMADYDQVGYYNCATHISKALLPVVTSLAAVALPRIATLKQENRLTEINALLSKSFSIVGFLSFPIAFAVIAISPVFVPLFYGQLFYGTILPLQIIILTVIVIGFNNLTGWQILLGLGFDKKFLHAIIVGAVTNFVLNLCLIPSMGAIGASIASIIAETMVLLVMLFFVYKYTFVRIDISRELLMDILIASLFFPISFLCKIISEGWTFVILASLLCSAMYMSLQYLFGNTSETMILNAIKVKFKQK